MHLVAPSDAGIIGFAVELLDPAWHYKRLCIVRVGIKRQQVAALVGIQQPADQDAPIACVDRLRN
jgi:hypothetical protein